MVYTLTLPNCADGHLVPPEDAYLVAQNTLCVADGITRDPSGSSDFSLLSHEELLETYPSPSGARLAADVFCQTFRNHARSFSPSIDGIRRAFLAANAQISALNRQLISVPDFLINDLLGCVAAAAVVDDGTLYWGNVCDTGIRVFSRTGKVKLQTRNGMAAFEEHIANQPLRWERPEGRRLVREGYRNRPDVIADGQPVGYGALTGEATVEPFLDVGSVSLESGDIVLLYSDGFWPSVEREDFFAVLDQPTASLIDQKLVPYSLSLARRDPKKFGKERTVVCLRYHP